MSSIMTYHVPSYTVCEILHFGYGVEDEIFFRWIVGDNKSKIAKAKLRYNSKKGDYFISGRRKIYMGDLVRL